MNILINGRSVRLTALDETRDPYFLLHRGDFRAAPQRLYLWDCASGKGTPDPRPGSHVLDADMFFFYDDTGHHIDMGPDWKRKQEKAAMTDALHSLGLARPAELQGHLDRAFPPYKVAIPYDSLIDPIRAGRRIALRITERYLRWKAEFSARDIVVATGYFQIPIAYEFSSEVLGTCEGKLADHLFDGRDARGRVPIPEALKKMVDLHQKDLEIQREEAARAEAEFRRRMKELEEEYREAWGGTDRDD